MYSISQACKYLKITNQALYVAMKKKRIAGIRNDELSRYFFTKEALDEYKRSRYKIRTCNGTRLADPEKGEITIPQASKEYKIKPQKLYYNVRTGKLSFTRKKSAYVLNISEIEQKLTSLRTNFKRRSRKISC